MLRYIIILLLFLHLAACRHSPMTPAPAPAPAQPPWWSPGESTEFIRSRCGCTLYRDLCYASLSPYAPDVRRSPVLLARLAANLTIARLRGLRAHVSALRLAAGGREASALRDCSEQLGDAADQLAQTAEELRGLEALVGMEVSWRVSNAQTWLSAALSNEESCSDGFNEVPAATDVKADVCLRVRRVKQYTSNTLALVNSLVRGRR